MITLDNRYYNEKIINIKNYLNRENLQTLEKLGIKLENKFYTAYEYEIFSGEVSKYYKEDDYSEEDLEFVESLEGTGVRQKEYDNLMEKMDIMAEIVYSKKYEGVINE